jgi:DNA-binding MarR family transcriptional regulator
MKIHESISYRLARVATGHRTSLEKSMNEIGLHGGQAFVLLELWKRDGMRQVDLAKRLEVSRPTINKTLAGLIESGFVIRTKVDDDARSTRIFLTELGMSVEEKVREQWHQLEERLLGELTETEVLVLHQLLGKLGPAKEADDDD